MMENYIYELENHLYEIHESQPDRIRQIESKSGNALTKDMISQINDLDLNQDLVKLYKVYNGLSIKWISDNATGIGGRMHFLPLEEVIKSWEGYLYESADVAEDADIRYFHPFDLISEEAQCGIIIDPKSEANLIGYNYSGEMDIHYLDLDFKGYMEMAVEARVYNYWPKVLIDVKNKEETSELLLFKENMPKIFKDFDFNKFMDKYQSLRTD